MVIPVNKTNIFSDIQLPSVLSNALVVFRVGATYEECDSTYSSLRSCCVHCSSHTEPLLPPLLEHTFLEHMSPSEAHFYPLTHARPLLLHTHTGAPFISYPHKHGIKLNLYTSPDCKVTSLHLRVDWWGSLGRAGARYWTAVPGWAVGVVAWMLFSALGQYERGGRHRRFLLQHILTHIGRPDA